MSYTRMTIACRPRRETVDAAAAQLVSAMGWIRGVGALDSDWWATHRRTQATMPCGDLAQAVECLEAGVYPIGKADDEPPEFYKQTFFVGPRRSRAAQVSMTCCLGQAVFGIEAPNVFEITFLVPLNPHEFRQVLVGIVGIFRPEWGCVVPEAWPRSRSNTPAVGWITYLSGWFGAPPPLAPPVTISAMKSLGTIIQAFPEPIDAKSDAHRAALRDLERRLREQHTLRPFAADSTIQGF